MKSMKDMKQRPGRVFRTRGTLPLLDRPTASRGKPGPVLSAAPLHALHALHGEKGVS